MPRAFVQDYYLNSIKEIMGSEFRKPKSIEEAFEIASKIVGGEGHRYKTFQLLKDLVNIPDQAFLRIISLWNKQNMIPLATFASYAAYVLKVDIFFILCTSSGLISRERKSSRADIAYLYYLPFANIFTSGDNLHRRVTPLFLDPDQRFIYGPDLKEDLAQLDEHFFQSKSVEEKQQGVYSFAWKPPDNDRFLTTRMWNNLRPKWRLNQDLAVKPSDKESQKVPEGLKEHIKKAYEQIKAQKGEKLPPEFDLETANDVIIKRNVRARRGKWQLFSKEMMESRERLMPEEDDTDL